MNMMLSILIFVSLGLHQCVYCQNWMISPAAIRPWETYLQLGEIQRPLGLVLNRNNTAHYHFYVGYLALHSFMYETAQEAFDLAINASGGSFIEAYIGKMLGCKQALWSYTDFACARSIYSIVNPLPTTPFQRELLSIVYRWYANESFVALGENNFLDGIKNLSLNNPNETDIQVLYGLSLLNVADQVEFQNITEPPKMIESRSILKAANANEPKHPGALHYLIHAYDVVSVNISEQGRPYANAFTDLVRTSSHGQHMPAHIWMRVGDWKLAANADRTAILVSYTLCAIKIRNQLMNTTSSIELPLIWNQVSQNVSFLQCDEENRAHSMEWLAYTAMQTGDWTTCFTLIRDLYMSYNATTPEIHYLPFAYRTQARTMIDLFYWFPYKSQFFNRTNQLLTLFSTQNFVPVNNNATRWYPIWSEAGLRFSECLRILSMGNLTTSLINDHLARFIQLSNMTSKLNQYVSASISLMPYQIRGIQAFVNESWQECLNQLSAAVEREKQVIPDANSPTLGFARSSELLAIHLLLIYEKSFSSTNTMKANFPSSFILNNQTISINDFPSRALTLYQSANSTTPNRAIGLLGMAQANTKMQNNAEAARLYNLLKNQLSLSNTTDNGFLQEVLNALNQLPSQANGKSYHQDLLTILSLIFILYFLKI